MEDEKIPLSNLVGEILELVNDITTPTSDEFTRKNELGLEWYFKEIETDYTGLKKYLHKITKPSLEQIPDFQLNIIKNNLDQLNAIIEQIKNFSSKPKRPVGLAPNVTLPENYVDTIKNQIVQAFKQAISRLYNSTQIIITFGKTAALEELEKLEDAVSFTKVNATATQVSSQVDIFDGHKKDNKTKARVWLGFAIAIAIFLGLFVWYGIERKDEILILYKDNKQNMNIVTAELVRLIVIRILEISLLSYALAFCIKNYNSRIHNSIVNDHKANCLKTYLFFEGSNIFKNNESTRQEILKKASDAIFEKEATGYSNEDVEVKSPSIISNIIQKGLEK
ncbi:hypothetical protein [Ferruginibacter albus]|uniref:hypothetical protein n=1 Tax=Ferruginibacter albus TaxID=2875540 RepID=UPI001CC7A7A6|nr:hypothetical protein [Ferruginibacter albus]UAY52704.1 hypothetical protein K9M53_03185 [Ferruginibacter albus]